VPDPTFRNKYQLLSLSPGKERDFASHAHNTGSRSREGQQARGARHGLRRVPYHAQSRRDRPKRSIGLSPDERPPALCIDCHDVKSADLQKTSPEPALRNRANLRELPLIRTKSASPEHSWPSSAPPVRRQAMRDLPRARDERRKSGADSARRQVFVRDLPTDDKSQADRYRQGSASGSGGRLHGLPQSPRQPTA